MSLVLFEGLFAGVEFLFLLSVSLHSSLVQGAHTCLKRFLQVCSPKIRDNVFFSGLKC